jgi:glutamate racemase
MLAFLHTAAVHIATFDELARSLDSAIPVRHEVRETLLSDVRAAGVVTEAVRSAVADTVRALAREGAKVIVCTCSTIGGVAESVVVSARVSVMRIDRPMAELAVASEKRVLAMAALQSTLEPTLALLHQVAAAMKREVSIEAVLCPEAWRRFEAGDSAGYARVIAQDIERCARPGDIVVLAQASMAPAEALVQHLGIPVLSSPRTGVLAAFSRYRAQV